MRGVGRRGLEMVRSSAVRDVTTQRTRRRAFVIAAAALLTGAAARTARAEWPEHPAVAGRPLETVALRAKGARKFRTVAWPQLSSTPLAPGTYELRLTFDARRGDAVELPVCAGRVRVTLDGAPQLTSGGPVVLSCREGKNELALEITVSPYEKRIACGFAPRVGPIAPSREGLTLFAFESRHALLGGGRAAVFVPQGHTFDKPAPVLLGAHPWNGSMWTYAAYEELLRAANEAGVVLLMPSGLGNSLYTAEAEDEVMTALDALARAMPIDPRRVSIWGASMGGAGATTIGFHRPDRFASITSFFGDARYDLKTYVGPILRDEAGARAVNALDIADNVRHVPVWLIHGEDDRVSPIAQSEMLARALRQRGYRVRFDRVRGKGHEASLVVRFLPELVRLAEAARTPEDVRRVTYRSVRPIDTGAYGVRFTRAGAEDAFVDIERRADAVHVLKATGVRRIALSRGAFGALGAEEATTIVIDDPSASIEAVWSGATGGTTGGATGGTTDGAMGGATPSIGLP